MRYIFLTFFLFIFSISSAFAVKDYNIKSGDSSFLFVDGTSGNVGIGTITPEARFKVIGTGTGTGTAFQVDDSAYAPKVTILDNGNVGIGSALPSQLLDVNGVLKLGGSGDSSFIGNLGIGVTAPTHALEVSGDVYASVFNGAFIGDGSGLTNISTVTGWTVSGNNIYNSNSANVGIGSTVPRAKLDVEGNVYFGGGNVGVGTAASVANLQVGTGAPSLTLTTPLGANDALIKGRLEVDGVTYFNGYVGISNTSPGYQLDVTGVVRATSTIYSGAGTGVTVLGDHYVGVLDTASFNLRTVNIARMTINSTGNVGIGTITPLGKLTIVGAGTSTGTALQVDDSTYTPRFTVLDNGNVGIGSILPAQKLDINGDLRLGGSGDSYFAGNLGVGVPSPSHALEVAGNVFATSFTGDGSGLTGLSAATGWTVSGNNIYNSNSANVGIGSTVPSAKLDVVGSAIINGDVIIDLK